MTHLHTAARQAQQALRDAADAIAGKLENPATAMYNALIAEDALRAALEAQQEPVGWYDSKSGWLDFGAGRPVRKPSSPDATWIPVYAHPPAQPQGWVLVPEEPTPEMLRAGEEPVVIGFAVDNYGREVAGKAYRAMLAARPKEAT